ncbi:MAG: PIG-L family deacetylase [Deltaproteobacteria bacterium]|nr:PIG-L family deacetylase [Deltaproteobacteria bacterium]
MKKRILLLLAHPDDETFGPGGTIARYAHEGADVYLATATKGQAGMVGDPPVTDREHLGEVRAAELLCAAGILGIRKVIFLGFVDGRLVDTPRERIVEKAVEQIRWIRPHVLIGFGPEGVSRHPDHIVMSQVALEAFDAAADPSRFPGQLVNGIAPWGPYKLYQYEISREILSAWNVPLAGIEERELTTILDTSAYVEKKVEAFFSHRTQAKDYNRILSREGYREFARRETYVLAKSRVAVGPLPETDLFEGIRGEEEGERR